jgi:hypothetical protein
MDIIRNNKGGMKLCSGGYLYTQKERRASRVRWECSERRGQSFKGALTTNIGATVVYSRVEHTHASDDAKVEAAKIRNALKAKCEYTRDNPAQLIVDTLHDVPVNVRAALGPIENIKRMIRGHRANDRPEEPTQLSQLILPDRYRQTADHARFLLYDNSVEDCMHKLLVFASDVGLKCLHDLIGGF